MASLSPTLDALVVPSEDDHQSEYVSAGDKCREFVFGFTGSAGLALITKNKTMLWILFLVMFSLMGQCLITEQWSYIDYRVVEQKVILKGLAQRVILMGSIDLLLGRRLLRVLVFVVISIYACSSIVDKVKGSLQKSQSTHLGMIQVIVRFTSPDHCWNSQTEWIRCLRNMTESLRQLIVVLRNMTESLRNMFKFTC